MDTIELLEGIMPDDTLSTWKAVEQLFEQVEYTAHVLPIQNAAADTEGLLQDMKEAIEDIYQEALILNLAAYGVYMAEDVVLPLNVYLQLLSAAYTIVNDLPEDLSEVGNLEESGQEITFVEWAEYITGVSLSSAIGDITHVDPKLLELVFGASVVKELAPNMVSRRKATDRFKRYCKQEQVRPVVALALAEGELTLPLDLEKIGPVVNRMIDYGDILQAQHEWMAVAMLSTCPTQNLAEVLTDTIRKVHVSPITVAIRNAIDLYDLSYLAEES